MTEDEAEEIYMAWQVGANFPEEKLAEAILILKAREQLWQDTYEKGASDD